MSAPEGTRQGTAAAEQRAALLVVGLSSFITPLLLSSVNVAIPSIAEGLAADAIVSSWFATAYLLSAAVCVVPFGRLADIHGRRRVFLAGMSLVAVTSLLAASAGSATMLIAWRVLQGIGGAMLFATGTAIVSSAFPPERRGRAIGLTVSMVYLGLTCGPLLGGWFTEHLGWRSVFVFHLPLTLAAIALILTRLRHEWAGTPQATFDLPGALIYGASIVALMYGVTVLPSIAGFGLIAAGLAGLVAFLRFEGTRAEPVFQVGLFRTSQVFTFSCTAALIMYAATFANTFLLSLYLQHPKGLSADAAGLVMMAQPAMMALLSPVAGRLSDRIEPRVLATAGMAVSAAGLALLATVDAATGIGFVVGALAVVGLGFALFSSPNVNAIMGAVERRYYGQASSSVATVRVLGQMCSMAVVTIVFALLLGRTHIDAAGHAALIRAIDASFLVAAALCAAGTWFSFARGRVRGGA